MIGGRKLWSLLNSLDHTLDEIHKERTSPGSLVLKCERGITVVQVTRGSFFDPHGRALGTNLLYCTFTEHDRGMGGPKCRHYPLVNGQAVSKAVAEASSAAFKLGGVAAWSAVMNKHVRFDQTMWRLWRMAVAKWDIEMPERDAAMRNQRTDPERG